MGLRGPGAKAHSVKPARARRRSATLPWRRKGLDRADRVIAFLQWLPVTKGVLAGKKMRLLPGQVRFVRKLYGELDEDGHRRIRLAVKSEPRGNGKTGLLSGLALCHLLGPEAEARGEVYSAASDKLQAGIIFREMKAIVERVPELAERVNVQRHYKILEVMDGPGAGSIYESLSADERRAHGLSPSLWIFDEYGVARNSELFDNLLTAQGKRAEGLGIVISTQAANDQHPLSQLIDDGMLGTDPSVYVQLACAPDDADIFAEATWLACNEALGHFLDEKEFRAQARRAKRLPSFRAKFQNLRLNMRVDADVRYISDTDWMKCSDAVSRKALAGELCFAGLDLSQTRDMTALVLFFPDSGAVLPFFWLPAEGLLERGEGEATPYRVWREQGLLEVTPGRALDYKFVVKRLAEIAAEFAVTAIAYDRAFIKQLQRLLDEEGIQVPLQEFGQGFVSMAQPVQALEAAVLDGRIRHGGHAILRWNVSNAAIDMDAAGNRKVTKKRSAGHVDGLVALLMAMGAAARTPKVPVIDYSRNLVLSA